MLLWVVSGCWGGGGGGGGGRGTRKFSTFGIKPSSVTDSDVNSNLS